MKKQHRNFSSRSASMMTIAAWIIFLALLGLFFQRYLERQSNPNQALAGQYDASAPKEIRLKRNRQGHYVAPGEINGNPVIFIVDTGATHIAVPGHIARKLGLKRGMEQRSMTAGGITKSYSTQLASVRLGNITMSDLSGSIIPDMPGNQILLGMSFLKHLELVQKNGVLLLRQ